MKIKPGLLFLLLSNVCVGSVLAQSLPVGQPILEDFYRRKQLLGEVDSSISFTVRPLSLKLLSGQNKFYQGAINESRNADTGNFEFQILPISLLQQYIVHHPFGWNNGPIIPAKGYQSMITAGVFVKYGPLIVQIKPEYVFASNLFFKQFKSYYERADIPERFGNGTYSKFFWGQSSIRLNAGPVSLGLSSENLWWGPGIRNSLLMSNNAPGFKHITLNTIRPIRTYIGSFEGQIVGGRLEQSGFTTGLSDDWRYLSAMVISYHPKWVPGLFLGMTRSFQQYSKQDRSFGDYFPLFQPFQKINTSEDTKERDQLTSLYARWLFTKSKAEVYFEYGLNDHSYDLRDFLMSPEHSRAYTIGMKKLLPLRSSADEYIQAAFELTHMEQSLDRVVREAGEWYTHDQVRHGYTNEGRVLGAGIGPGGNFQSFDVSWFKGLKHIGLQLERYEHNGDYAYILNRGQWVDFGVAAVSDWTYKDFIFNTKVEGIQSINYQWNSGVNGYPKQNVFNLAVQLGITYRF
jgi:hypothetical protein